LRVVATAGHVDHGKSTLVRRLTGMEPDRWAEERRRGMTIDLGYAWTTLRSGVELAFVDVPGHQRFIANMLAGVGPAAAVLFVVAADEGWRAQSAEHLAAIDALRMEHGLLAVTRSDLADPAPACAEAVRRLAASSLGEVEAVTVSGTTGAGLDELRGALDRLALRVPEPDASAPVRLWVDRSFTVRGSGTVVTGTLGEGTIGTGDRLDLRGRVVTVRGVQSLGAARERVSGPARVALNLRGVPHDGVTRGDVLLAPASAWHRTDCVDVRLSVADEPPSRLMLHVGTAALSVRVRPLAPGMARLSLAVPLPLRAGDRAVLRDPGRRQVAAGVLVLDADPPALVRRGAAAARAAELASASGALDSAAELARRGIMRESQLRALGGAPPPGAHVVGEWLVAPAMWQGWLAAAPTAARQWSQRNPVDPDMPLGALARDLALPDPALAAAVAAAARLPVRAGRVAAGRAHGSLGPAERAVQAVEARLRDAPFDAPEADELAALRLTRRELAAAERTGRLLRLSDSIVVLPSAPDHAVDLLRALPQPFTTSEARRALGTTRRVVIPLLEYLDAHGHTERLDDTGRRSLRHPPSTDSAS
jgi:selenocysteine-specific elongation factor